ncbi:MAG: hypothetical protein Mars2KO_01470 [Maribacter sp.]
MKGQLTRILKEKENVLTRKIIYSLKNDALERPIKRTKLGLKRINKETAMPSNSNTI